MRAHGSSVYAYSIAAASDGTMVNKDLVRCSRQLLCCALESVAIVYPMNCFCTFDSYIIGLGYSEDSVLIL